jgi:hypothetical protein
VVTFVLALVGQAVFLSALVRSRHQRTNRSRAERQVADLSADWSHALTGVLVASQATLALCPWCQFGSGDCLCERRRQQLAHAVTAAETIAARHGSEHEATIAAR